MRIVKQWAHSTLDMPYWGLVHETNEIIWFQNLGPAESDNQGASFTSTFYDPSHAPLGALFNKTRGARGEP